MAETKTKTLVYKRCNFHKGSGDLEQLLKAAMGKKKTIGSRRQSLAPKDEPPIWLVIAQKKEDDAFLFGLLVQYTPGTDPSFLIDDDKALALSVEHIKAPKTADGKDRQLLEAMLFFAVTENHLVMMQSLSLRSLQLERHLQWLLHDAKLLAADDTIRLSDHLPKKVRTKLERAPIRSLTIGGGLEDAPPALKSAPPAEVDGRREDGGSTQAEKRLSVASMEVASSTGSPAVLDMLKGLVGPSKAAQLSLDNIDGSNIEYSLRIRYKRQTTDDGQKFMNQLGSALRHSEGIDTTIKLVGGGSISGDELRLSGPVKITTTNGVPNPDDVFEAMRSWLLERVKSGDIGG